MILFYWVVRSSLMASILVVFILILKLMLRDRLGAKWHYYIWFLVLLRMAIPLNLQSPVSIFNYFSTPIPAPVYTDTSRPNDFLTQLQERTTGREAGDALVSNPGPIPDSNSSQAEPTALPPSRVSFFNLRTLYSIWIVGVFALLFSMLFMNLKFWSTLKGKTNITDASLVQLFEGCKGKMGITKNIPLIQTDTVKTTTLFGFIRPRLLLPANITKMLSFDELRYIFFHELAHIKQKDIAINLMVGLLQILHWFNPILWYGFYRMRQDREVACDALALSYVHPGEYKEYGKVIIDLLENFSRPSRISGMIGIVSDDSNAKQRISRISMFKKNSHRLSITAILMLVVFGIMFLTSANEVAEVEKRGNSIGNLFTGEGQFAAEGEWIYYSNPDYDGRLFKKKRDESHISLVSDDTIVRYINVVDGWIYYNSTPHPYVSNYDGPYLYKVRIDGSDRTRLTDHRAEDIQVVGDWIYYMQADYLNREFYFHRLSIDGQEKTIISNTGGVVSEGWVYYTRFNPPGIYKMKVDGTGETRISDDTYVGNLNVVGNWLYFTDTDTGIYKMSTDGKNRTRIYEGFAYYINVTEDSIFFLDSWWNIYKLNTNGSEVMRLNNHPSNYPNVIGEWVYYQNDGQIRRVSVDAPHAEPNERETLNLSRMRHDLFKTATDTLGYLYAGDDPEIWQFPNPGVMEVYYSNVYGDATIIYGVVPLYDSWDEIFAQVELDIIKLFAEISKMKDIDKMIDILSVEILPEAEPAIGSITILGETLVNTEWSQIKEGELKALLVGSMGSMPEIY